MRRRPTLIAGLIVLLVAAGVVGLVLTGGEAPQAGRTQVPASGGAAGLAISPVRSVVDNDGEAVVLTYTLSNSNKAPTTYSISTGELDGTGRRLPSGPSNAGAWARPRKPQVTVAPKQDRSIRVRVTPPASRGATTRRIGVTFTDMNPADGTVSLRAQVTTSVYVLGTGPAIRKLSLSRVRMPIFAHGSIPVSAVLRNQGTTTLVPGSLHDSVIGTVSQGRPFSLSGDVIGPGKSAQVSGILQPSHFACWCEVRITAPGDGASTVSVTRRVLILPWPLIWGVIAAALLLLVVSWWRRRPEPTPARAIEHTPPPSAPEPTEEPPKEVAKAAATAPAQKAPTKATPAKKAPARKAPPRKAPAGTKRSPAKKTVTKKTATAEKAPAKKAPAKKAPAKKRPAAKSATSAARRSQGQ